MDNVTSTSQPFTQTSSYTQPSTTSSGTFFDSLKNINITTWILIILLLAFLGFNIFVYLAKGTQTITDITAPIMSKLFGTTVAVTGQTVDVAAEGAKVVVGETANVLESGLTAVQDITPNKPQTTTKGQPISPQKQDSMQQTSLNKALNTQQPQQQPQQQNDYQAHEATSSTGWCYIGEDRGFRTCAEVGVNDSCMSGEIFPSHEICMNPNLRA
jgi:hypothetical protein